MKFVLFIIFALRCSLLTSCSAMIVNQNSTLMTEKKHSSTIISPHYDRSNDTWNNAGRRSGKKTDKKRKMKGKYGEVSNKNLFLSRDNVKIFKESPLRKNQQLEKMILRSSEKIEYNRKRNLDSTLDQTVLKNRQRRQFLPGKGLLNILNSFGPRSIAANPGLFGSLGNAGLFANKLQRNQASNIIDPSLGLLGGLNPFDGGGGSAAAIHGGADFTRKDVVRQFKGPQVHVKPSVANIVDLDPNVHDLLGKWHLVYVSPSTATFYQSIPHCHVSYVYDENGRNDKFILREAFKQSSSISTNLSWVSYKRSAIKYSPGRYWLTMENQFYPQQFNIVKLGKSDPQNNQTSTDYQYFIATDNGNLGFSVFARYPETFFQIFDLEVRSFLETSNFDAADKYFWFRPITVYHGVENCPYPNEVEIQILRNPVVSIQQMSDYQPIVKNCTPAPMATFEPKFQSRLVRPPEVDVPESKIDVLDAVRRKLPPGVGGGNGAKDQELVVQPKRIVNNFNLFGSIFGP